MPTEKLSIIIVNFNSSKLLNSCIKSLKYIDDIYSDLIIIDNKSSNLNDLDYEKYEKITLIKNRVNVGFAKAVNQGIRFTKNKYILLLNPDSTLIDNSIELLLNEISTDPNIGIIGGKIISNNQKYTATNNLSFLTGLFEFTNFKKIFRNNKFSKHFWIENKHITKPIEVSSLCGAFLMFRKKISDQTIFFDEKFFMYLEDVDFCLSVKNKGFKIIYDPNAKIEHLGGGSSKSRYKINLKYWYESRKYLFSKHLNKFESIILNIIFTMEENILCFYHHLTHTPNE